MRIIFVLLFVTQLNLVFGQVTAPDTVFVKRDILKDGFQIDTFIINPGGASYTQVLVGTTLLPYSDKMIGLLNNGLSGISLELLDGCNGSEDEIDYKNYPKFLKVTRDSTVLTIDVSIASLCCNNFLGEAEVIGGDTLNLTYTSYGGFCSCDCCYTLRYKFDTYMEEEYQILKYVIINGHRQSTARIPDIKKKRK